MAILVDGEPLVEALQENVEDISEDIDEISTEDVEIQAEEKQTNIVLNNIESQLQYLIKEVEILKGGKQK